MSEGRQIIFSMVNVSRTLPAGKTILKDIYLSREQLEARKVSPAITQEQILQSVSQKASLGK